MVSRTACITMIAALLASGVAWAGPDGGSSAAQARRPSTVRRVVWTAIGAGAGFAAGLLIGFDKFDDAIDSDRKIWTSALVGAAAGGIAGAVLSRDLSPTPRWAPARANDVHGRRAWEPAQVFRGSTEDQALLARVRRVSGH